MIQLWLRNLLWEVIKKEELFFKNYFFQRGEEYYLKNAE